MYILHELFEYLSFVVVCMYVYTYIHKYTYIYIPVILFIFENPRKAIYRHLQNILLCLGECQTIHFHRNDIQVQTNYNLNEICTF